jgi:uncharacterized membrane protein YkvI
MELSIYLAKLIGIYLLIVAADMLLRRREIRGAIRDFASSKGLLVFSGSISLLLGLAIVIAHPIYESTLQGFITLLGYLLILRGVWRIAFPTHVQKRLASLFHRGYWTIFIILLILGIYLTHAGFTAEVL